MVIESAPPGKQCCWCDCPDTPDSPHLTPGYKCGRVCPAPAIHMARFSGTRPALITYLLCERHHDGPVEQLISLGLVESVVFGPSWKDPD